MSCIVGELGVELVYELIRVPPRAHHVTLYSPEDTRFARSDTTLFSGFDQPGVAGGDEL